MELDREQVIRIIEEEKAIAILRGGQGKDALNLAEALLARGGREILEAIYNQANRP